MTVDLERPLRNPDTGSAPLMSKRARWLVVLGFVLPGSAQLLAGGSRRLGRFGLGATFFLLALGVAALVGFFTARETTLALLSNTIVLLIVQGLLVVYAVLWLVLGFDTLRLAKLIRVSPGWRMPVALLSIVLTVLPAAGAAWAATTVGAARGVIAETFVNAQPTVDPVDGRYNILLLGADTGEEREGVDGVRPDSISLVSVDAESGQSAIIGLPRELTEMPFPETSPMFDVYPEGFCTPTSSYIGDGYCYTTGYLNALYTELEASGSPSYEGMYADAASHGSSPGIEALKDAVTGATGLEVQFFVLIDMKGFASMIDALGGVTVDVKERIPVGGREDEWTGEWVDIAWYIEPGVQTLNGENAQWYARARHGFATGDYARMERQRELQSAILAQMDPANVLLRFQEVAGAGTDMVQTDIPSSMLGYFVNLASKSREFTPVTFDLTPPEVDPEYLEHSDYARIHELVAQTIAAATPAPEEEQAE